MNKYRNKKVEIDGIKFDSKHEGEYYLYLKKLKNFAIYHWNGEVEYIDVKGMETQQGVMRKKDV